MDRSRRGFVKSSLAAGTLSFLPFRFGLPLLPEAEAATLLEDSPVLRAGQFSSREFNGDDIERVHTILWNVDGYIQKQGGLPAPSEDVPVVVVGGGIAGLYSAYLLRGVKPLILEQDRAFGGNSKAEQLGDSRYSIGAAYITTPKPGSDKAKLLRELGLLNDGRIEHAQETTVFIKNRFAKGFWAAATDPEARQDFERVFRALEEIQRRFEQDEGDEWQMKIDAISFEAWLKQTFGRVHPHLLEYFQLYAWSSFAASIDELSAVQMLSFIAAETGSLMTFPGGNGAIAERLHTRLVKELGRDRVRSGCLVVRIQKDGDSLLVSYADPNNALKTIRAKTCIFAAPKFAARKAIVDLPADQAAAMSRIQYRGYVVANVILDRAISSPCYELYHLENQVPPSPTAMRPSPRPFTDLTFGTWAQGDRGKHSVLTVYKAFAFDGDRQFLFNPLAHDKHRGRILEGVKPVLATFGLDLSNVKGVRMTRWGHSLPVAAVGLQASGLVEKAHQPIAGKIFFANQDNWANPSFETAMEEALTAAKGVARHLRALRR